MTTQELFEPLVINGAMVEGVAGQVIFSVTLGNGFIVSTPGGFGSDQVAPRPDPRPLPPPVAVFTPMPIPGMGVFNLCDAAIAYDLQFRSNFSTDHT